jgi:hypothetical protein
VLRELIEDCAGYLQKKPIRCIIASPTFGTGFSIDAGIVHTTFGFMFRYPPNTHDCVQMMARARKPESVLIYVENVDLGHYYKFGPGRGSLSGRQVDVSWKAQKAVERLAAQGAKLTDILAEISDPTSDPSSKYNRVWSEFTSIKKAEEDVQKQFGASILFDRLAKVTGADLLPIERFLREQDIDKGLPNEHLQAAIDRFVNPDRKAQRAKLAATTEKVLDDAFDEFGKKGFFSQASAAVVEFHSKNPFKGGGVLGEKVGWQHPWDAATYQANELTTGILYT